MSQGVQSTLGYIGKKQISNIRIYGKRTKFIFSCDRLFLTLNHTAYGAAVCSSICPTEPLSGSIS